MSNENRFYAVLISPAAWRELMNLPERVQQQVLGAVEELEVDPRPSGVVKLEGEDALYRVRSGDYRIVYQIEDNVLRVLVIKIANRREVYKKKR